MSSPVGVALEVAAAQATQAAAPAGEAVRTTAEVRLPLWGELALADPLFLVALLLVPLVMWLGRARRRHASGNVPVLLDDAPRSLAQRLGWLPGLMQGAALVLVLIALSRPLRGNVISNTHTEGVDIVLLVDKSSSMEARARANAPTRFDIVKEVVGDFAIRRMTDSEGASDNVCLISFALYPTLLCPFTLDVDAVRGILGELETEKRRELDATGYGIALAKAVDVLQESDSAERIVVLLTDGRENVEVIRPLEAAQLAAEHRVRVYTIYVGPKVIEQLSLLGPPRRTTVDTSELERVAELTEGRFFHAEGKEDLEEVYNAIENLERTERTEESYAEHYDLYPKFVAGALALYLLAWLSLGTWARRLP